jgi:L-cysteine:1D-myo-inositol 2-amino-2-deoxy-alpha-D-glucopyranoside ligase
MVGYRGEKMSKSRGNLVFVSELRAAGVDPAAIRLALLEHDYRHDWEWHDEELEVARERLDRWRTAFERGAGPPAASTVQALRHELANGIDTPAALRVVDRWCATEGTDADAPRHVATAVDALLGVR